MVSIPLKERTEEVVIKPHVVEADQVHLIGLIKLIHVLTEDGHHLLVRLALRLVGGNLPTCHIADSQSLVRYFGTCKRLHVDVESLFHYSVNNHLTG